MEADHQYHQACAAPPVARDNMEAAMRTITVDIDKICHDLSWCLNRLTPTLKKNAVVFYIFRYLILDAWAQYFGNNAPSCERLSLL